MSKNKTVEKAKIIKMKQLVVESDSEDDRQITDYCNNDNINISIDLFSSVSTKEIKVDQIVHVNKILDELENKSNNKLCSCNKKATHVVILYKDGVKCYKCGDILHQKDVTFICEKIRGHNIGIDELVKYNDYYCSSWFDDHDECSNCGVRNMGTWIHIIIPIEKYDPMTNYNEYCIFCKCNELCKYSLNLCEDILCSKCNNVKFKKNRKLNLCSSTCSKEFWNVDKYYTNKKDTHFNASFINYKSKCFKCNHVEKCTGIFEGHKY